MHPVAAVGLLLGSLLVAWPASAQVEVRFRLVAEEHYRGAATPAERFLRAGEIRLYRPGDTRPRQVVAPNQGVTVAEGTWYWIAEADPLVSAEIGELIVPRSAAGGPASTVLAVLVPGCLVDLGARSLWPGTESVTFHTLEKGAEFALPLEFRTTIRIPAGRFVASSRGARGLLALSRPRTCTARERLVIAPLTPPERDREDWLVRLEGPAPELGNRQAFSVLARSPLKTGPPPVRAVSGASRGRSAVFFLYDVPAPGDRFLSVQHPRLRTADQAQPLLGGRAVEIPLVVKPRRSLAIAVDYRPAREHRKAHLVLVDCGLRPRILADDAGPDCKERERFERPLRPGRAEYRFDHLDDGQYRFDAVIDDEVVWGLGSGIFPRLDPLEDIAPPPLEADLVEFHVFGNLLEDGEPVPGFVGLYAAPRSKAPSVELATDDEDLYHLYYFGFRPQEWRFEGVRRHLRPESRSLDPERRISACSSDRRCRVFNGASSIVGGGRWDIELGVGGTVEVRVVDASSGAPVPGVLVTLPASPATYFVEGRVVEAAPREPRYADSLPTDAAGRAAFRWWGRDPFTIATFRLGYESATATVVPRPGATATLEIAIEPDAGRP